MAAVAAATLPSIGCQSKAVADWSSEYDWICVGAGAAGCASAIFGHDKGFKTLLVEKSAMIGGTTAQSGGSIWVPLNYLAKAKGIPDSRQDALDYLQFVGGGYSVPAYAETFVDNAAQVLEYLRDKVGFKFRLAGSEFYYPVAKGSRKLGRLINYEPFPAEDLGEWRQKVQMSVFVRGFAEALEGSKVGERLENFGPYRYMNNRIEPWRKVLGPAKVEEILKADEAQRVEGNALISYLFRGILKRGIEVRTETPVGKVLVENGRVVGITINHKGKRENIRARRGVVLGVGGDVNGRGGHGPNWMLAGEVGGLIDSESFVVPMATLHAPGEDFPNGSAAGRPNAELQMSHSIVVNRFGERFADESFFQKFGAKLNEFEVWDHHRFQNIPCYLIFDSLYLQKHIFDGLPPGNTDALEDWVAKGSTLAQVAEKLKIPAAKLQATVARYNETARRGKDPEFNRRPETIGSLEKSPFYGVQLTPASDPFRAGTKVAVNTKAQVLHHATQEPIPNLYACGAVAASRLWGIGYQAGFSLMAGMTFGYLATQHAATAAA